MIHGVVMDARMSIDLCVIDQPTMSVHDNGTKKISVSSL